MTTVPSSLALPLQSKPRKTGRTSIIDYGPDNMGWTGENGVADLLNCAGNYIDFAKIYALNSLIIPPQSLKRIINVQKISSKKIVINLKVSLKL